VILDVIRERESVIQRLDPRARVVLAAVASVYPLFIHSLTVLTLCASGALVLCFTARIPLRSILFRLVALNVFMMFVVLLLPWSVPGRTLVGFGAWSYSIEGFVWAAQIVMRSHAIVLALTALIGGMEPVTFGHALAHLRVPAKLIQLFQFTVRYVAVLEREYSHLRRAMAMRAFEPRLNLHTLRSLGNLVGMLLVRALDRSERINEAMKCRGFTGIYPSFHHFRWGARDAAVSGVVVLFAGLALVLEWTWAIR
jgi:cobalt/nickel transport system permease protein